MSVSKCPSEVTEKILTVRSQPVVARYLSSGLQAKAMTIPLLRSPSRAVLGSTAPLEDACQFPPDRQHALMHAHASRHTHPRTLTHTHTHTHTHTSVQGRVMGTSVQLDNSGLFRWHEKYKPAVCSG